MEYLLKASAVVVLFYLCFNLFLKRETFFNHNRWFLFIGLVIALIFPLIVIPIHIPVEPTIATEATYIQTTPSSFIATPTENPFDWTQLISIIYVIGLAIFSIQFIMQFGSLALLLLKNPKYKDAKFTYVIIRSKISPFSFFKWIVYNPDNFGDEELGLILTHEKIHAKQLHSIDILLMQLACVIFWFNPLIWFYKREVRQNLEYIADYETQIKTRSQKDYQRLLLKTSVANHNISLSNHFYNSLIKERIVMLKKSRSKTKNQWKYLLILPLLGGLLMSMNTEHVYVPTETSIEASGEPIEFVVTKNTTDKELNAMTNTVNKKGGSLVFSQVQRNNKNELTSIFVKLYNHSFGGGTNQSPIEPFIIYKELYGNKGGYVGYIDNGTLHFDDDLDINNISNEDMEALKTRAYQSISRLNAEKSKKKLGLNHPNRDHQERIEIVFINTMTDAQLDEIKNELKSHSVVMTINSLKRNSKGEIKAIDIDFETKNGSTNYNIKSNNGIDPFYFNMSEDGSFGVGAHKETEIIIATPLNNNTSQKSKRSFVFSTGDRAITEIIVDSTSNSNNEKLMVNRFYGSDSTNVYTTYRANFENDSLYFYKGAIIDSAVANQLSNLKTDNYSQNDKPVKIISQSTTINEPVLTKNTFSETYNDKEKPLIVINGKIVDYKSLNTISPNSIESVTVLKGKQATDSYGENRKNGVIEIKTKDPKNSKSKTTKKNPWSVRTEVSKMGYIDDEDSSKNANLAFITKYTSDKALEKHKAYLEKFNLKVKFSKVKRNKAGEITSIKISVKNEQGDESSASWKNDDGIPGIEFGKYEGRLVARTSTMN